MNTLTPTHSEPLIKNREETTLSTLTESTTTNVLEEPGICWMACSDVNLAADKEPSIEPVELAPTIVVTAVVAVSHNLNFVASTNRMLPEES